MTLVPLVCVVMNTNTHLYNERRSKRAHTTPTKTHPADNVPALPDERKNHTMPTPCSWETSASTTPSGYSLAARYETPSLRHLASSDSVATGESSFRSRCRQLFEEYRAWLSARALDGKTFEHAGHSAESTNCFSWSLMPCVLTAKDCSAPTDPNDFRSLSRATLNDPVAHRSHELLPRTWIGPPKTAPRLRVL